MSECVLCDIIEMRVFMCQNALCMILLKLGLTLSYNIRICLTLSYKLDKRFGKFSFSGTSGNSE